MNADFSPYEIVPRVNWRKVKRVLKRRYMKSWRNGSDKYLRTMWDVNCTPKERRKPWRRNRYQ